MRDSRSFFDDVAGKAAPAAWRSVPQHRGRNAAEHTDLQIADIDGRRAVKLPGGALAVVDDRQRRIDFFSGDVAVCWHELRRIMRDEIAVPLMLEAGCRLFHAGFIEYEGVKILIIGPSGSGKTTLAFTLLGDSETAKYGSAERTLVWIDGERLVALGVPESITVFPGNLRGTEPFGDLVGACHKENDWARESKQRLQQFEIVERTGTAVIPGQSGVDLVVEVRYDKQDEFIRKAGASVAPVALEDVLLKNDLSCNDAVRLPWLNWFSREPGEAFYRELGAMAKRPAAVQVSWCRGEALMDAVLNLAARMRIGRPAVTVQPEWWTAGTVSNGHRPVRHPNLGSQLK